MLFQNCRELPIHNFNECVMGNLYYLIKNGEHYDDEIEAKWVDILDEYSELTASGNLIAKKIQMVAINLEIEKMRLLMAIDSPTKQQKEIIKRYLNKYRSKDIPKLITSLSNKLKRLIKEMPEEHKDSYSLDKSIAMMKANGFQIDRFTTPVSEYLEMINVLKERAKKRK